MKGNEEKKKNERKRLYIKDKKEPEKQLTTFAHIWSRCSKGKRKITWISKQRKEKDKQRKVKESKKKIGSIASPGISCR